MAINFFVCLMGLLAFFEGRGFVTFTFTLWKKTTGTCNGCGSVTFIGATGFTTVFGAIGFISGASVIPLALTSELKANQSA
ncbi:hypothetical protein [Streptococcus uberis]|uniref:hypothetical protein n=1 Tax=Streptococcus uberis TaxID=1349 RepID=UPI0019395DC6|nr:hypothetical protein [Streptococcus uberis]